MDRKAMKTFQTSSPRTPEQTASSADKNDSFLEDLDLVHSDLNAGFSMGSADRYVTTRHVQSPSVNPVSEEEEFQILLNQHSNKHSSASSIKNVSQAKPKLSNEPATRENGDKPHKLGAKTPEGELENKMQGDKLKVSDVRAKLRENKLKPAENRLRTEQPRTTVSNGKSKMSDNKLKAKERSKRSVSSKESSRSSDVCGKENSRPSDSSKESSCQSEIASRDHTRTSDIPTRKSDSKEKLEPVILLNAIKDLVSTYTKQESVKVLKAMQDLHINSQMNIVKQLILQTDEIIKEIHPSVDSSRLRGYIEENEKLHETIVFLQMRNEELQRKVDETEQIKQENVALKLKCKELMNQKYS